jgi:uncharacterized protein YgbK (DUF1537 family)
MTLRLLADDLTGALDTAAAFCGARGPVPVLLTAAAVAGDAAFDLGCRDAGEADAVAATRAALPLLEGADLGYLKIDSLLRGHWAAMLGVLWRTGRFRTCIFAPAFPAHGRITQGGRQWVRDAVGALHPIASDPAAALAAQGVIGVRLQDAVTDPDLSAIVKAAASAPGPVLWCGTAGLAGALAGAPVPQVTLLPAPAICVIGSCHPVSSAQLRHLADVTGEAPLPLDGRPTAAAAITAQWQRTGWCVVQVKLPTTATPAAAAARIAACLRATLPGLPPPGTLIAAGGETLRAACTAVGATQLTVEAAFAPGVPMARLRGGLWDGVRVVSKSGAFGAPGLLARLHAAVKDFDDH